MKFNNIKCTKFLFFLYIFYRNLKEQDHIKRNINSKKRKVYIGNQYYYYYYYFDLPKIRVGRSNTTKKLSCLCLSKKRSTAIAKFTKRKDCQQVWSVKRALKKKKVGRCQLAWAKRTFF